MKQDYRKKILLIEDNPSILQFLENTFRTDEELNKYEYLSVKTGIKALKLLDITSFDLVIADEDLGGVDGWVIVEWMGLFEDHRNTPFILLVSKKSALSISQSPQRSINCSYLAKPISPLSFKITLTLALSQRQWK